MLDYRRCFSWLDDPACSEFPLRKLSKAERKLDKLLLEILEFAHARVWADIGDEANVLEAMRLLEKRGLIEINKVTNQYRLKKQTPRS